MKTNNLAQKQNILLLFISIFLFFLSCKTHSIKSINSDEEKNKINNVNYIKDGFVIGCGGGCAMVYNINKININGLIYEVRFEILNYIDEKINEKEYQTIFFEYDTNGRLLCISQKGDNSNILKNKDSLMKDNLIKLGERLWITKNN